ncbi:carbohydrate esterase family 4 protein, partial [Piromyces sp. E2]
FDDGPYEYTSELIDLLNEAKIKATFFTNADFPTDKTKQEILKKMYASGHQVASHTWAHIIPNSHEEIKSMMTKFDNFLESVIGVKPKYFRAPQGNCDDSCIKYFEELGYKVIQWDTDTNDWNKSQGAETRVKLVKEFLTEEWAKNKDNYLVLMHDVQKHTVKEIVPWVIKHAPFDKYKFVTVAECLGNKNDMY